MTDPRHFPHLEAHLSQLRVSGLRVSGLFVFSLIIALWLGSPLAKAQDSKLLILGDSISAGYGINPDLGWVQLLAEKMQETHAGYQVVNGSISGNTTADGLARLPKLLDVHKPELVVIELGGNDGLRGYPLKIMRKNLVQLIEITRAANAQVLLVGIEIPPNYGERYTKQFRATFQRVANEQEVALVPFILEGVATNAEMMQDDGIHPTEMAQPQLLDNVWQYLEPMLANEYAKTREENKPQNSEAQMN